MSSGGKNDTTHAPGRGIRELDIMRIEYSEPLAAWIFPMQGMHGYVRYMGWMDVFVRVFLSFSETYRARWKKQSQQQRKSEQRRRAAQRPPQSGVHTAEYNSQQPGISQPAHISSPFVGCGLLTALWLARRK